MTAFDDFDPAEPVTAFDDFDPAEGGPAEGGPDEEPSAPERQYESMFDWFDTWFATLITRKLSGTAGKSGRVFCPEWWRHDEVVRRLRDLWLAWEGAEASENLGAPSAWWIHDADPMLRVLLDPDGGPMYLCSRDKHVTTPPLRRTLTLPPAGWFDGLD
ncbi:DUF4913 domain-containing protein [Rhodococcus sp. 5A-K4]|uniref:DUF4913 domain-containing protein n=1 Tax=Rhodococcus TaxID=1827 RepID=UPI00355C3D38